MPNKASKINGIFNSKEILSRKSDQLYHAKRQKKKTKNKHTKNSGNLELNVQINSAISGRKEGWCGGKICQWPHGRAVYRYKTCRERYDWREI